MFKFKIVTEGREPTDEVEKEMEVKLAIDDDGDVVIILNGVPLLWIEENGELSVSDINRPKLEELGITFPHQWSNDRP